MEEKDIRVLTGVVQFQETDVLPHSLGLETVKPVRIYMAEIQTKAEYLDGIYAKFNRAKKANETCWLIFNHPEELTLKKIPVVALNEYELEYDVDDPLAIDPALMGVVAMEVFVMYDGVLADAE